MKEKTRRTQLEIEKLRMPAIRAHPAFKKDPFRTIREHAAATVGSM